MFRHGGCVLLRFPGHWYKTEIYSGKTPLSMDKVSSSLTTRPLWRGAIHHSHRPQTHPHLSAVASVHTCPPTMLATDYFLLNTHTKPMPLPLDDSCRMYICSMAVVVADQGMTNNRRREGGKERRPVCLPQPVSSNIFRCMLVRKRRQAGQARG